MIPYIESRDDSNNTMTDFNYTYKKGGFSTFLSLIDYIYSSKENDCCCLYTWNRISAFVMYNFFRVHANLLINPSSAE
jgi:hypothetical protein